MSAGTGSGRRRGTLAEWDDDRGFGFISPADGGPRVFAHVSAFPRGGRPTGGRDVTFTTQRDDRGRTRAAEVRYAGGSRGRNAGRGSGAALAVASAFFVVLLALVAADRLWWVVVAAYAVLSVVAFAAYALDKSAARRGSWRTAESTLHTLGLVGGWPGALVARHVFRHKTTKQPFRTVFWLTVVINCAALAAYVAAGPTILP